MLSLQQFSATVYFCYSTRCFSVDQCPHSGPTQDIATELGRSRSRMHTRPSSAHPIGRSSSYLYSWSIILILGSVPRYILGESWLSAPGMSQQAALTEKRRKLATNPPANSASIATMARFAYIHDLIDPRNLLYSTGLIITSHLEIGVALTASSAATLRPLLVHLGVHSRHGQSQLSDQRHLDGGENARRHPSPEQSDLNLGE